MPLVPMAILLLTLALVALPTPCLAAGDVWFENSTTKVFRDDPPGGTKVAHLTAAANEVEAVQLVVRAGEQPLRAVNVQVSDLVSAEGARIGSDHIEILRVAYVYLPAHKREYPDALPPWAPCDIPAGQNQPVWLDIHVPMGALPGTYRGTVTLQSAGVLLQGLPLELTVWHFALPQTPRSRAAFGVYTQGIEAQHHVVAGSPQYEALLARYYEMLVAHRATPRAWPTDWSRMRPRATSMTRG